MKNERREDEVPFTPYKTNQNKYNKTNHHH